MHVNAIGATLARVCLPCTPHQADTSRANASHGLIRVLRLSYWDTIIQLPVTVDTGTASATAASAARCKSIFHSNAYLMTELVWL